MNDIVEKSQAEGVGQSSSIVATPAGVRLPKQPAKYVILSNWNVANDAAFTRKAATDIMEALEEEVYWGFNGVYAHQLFPGRSTELIPVNDLSQICIRSRPSENIVVWFSWII